MKTNFLLIVNLLAFFIPSFGDEWIQKNDVSVGRNFGTGFSIGKKGYIGTGSIWGTDYAKDFWEYDLGTDTWTQKADMILGRRFATGFSVNAKGYIGLGSQPNSVHLNDLWEYDPMLNLWTEKASMPPDGRYNAACFVIGDKAYVGTGYSPPNYQYEYSDLWEYDPLTDQWVQKADFPGGERYSATGFTIGAKGYVGCGSGNNMPHSDFWEYDSSSDHWTQKANFGGDPRERAAGFSIYGYGFMGLGNDFGSFKNDFWQYDPAANAWLIKSDFPGKARYSFVDFVIENIGYVATGYGETGAESQLKEVWEYMPDSISTSAADASGGQTIGLEVFPNPMVSTGMVSISLPVQFYACIELRDLKGNRIQNLFEGALTAGSHKINFNRGDIAPGIYLLQMKAGEETVVKKMAIQ